MNYAFLAGVFAAQGGGAAPPVGDIYFDDITALMEFNVPTDLSGDLRPMFISFRNENTVGSGVVSDASRARFGTRSLRCQVTNEGFVAPAHNNSVDFGTSDFCVEFWLSADAEPSVTGYFFGGWRTLSSQRHMRIGYNPSTNQVICEVSTTGADTISANFDCDTDGVSVATLFDGNFHHIAVTRNSGDLHVYVDGIRGATAGALSTNAIFFPTTSGRINTCVGASCNSNNSELPDNGVNCWLDEFRISVGISRYSGVSFTPPSARFGRNVGEDANFANVELLLDFETEFGPIYYGNLATPELNYRENVSNNDGDWRDAGIIANANDTILRVIESGGWNLGSGNFTIELFGFSMGGSFVSGRTLIGNWNNVDTERGWRFTTSPSSGVELMFQFTTDGTVATQVSLDGPDALVVDTLYDLCVERQGSDLHFYVDGILVVTRTISSTIFNASTANTALTVLAAGDETSRTDPCSTGTLIKAIRVTPTVARYGGATYTVPTLPLPKSA